MSALEALVLGGWLLAGLLEGGAYFRRRRRLSDPPGNVPGADAGNRPHNPGERP